MIGEIGGCAEEERLWRKPVFGFIAGKAAPRDGEWATRGDRRGRGRHARLEDQSHARGGHHRRGEPVRDWRDRRQVPQAAGGLTGHQGAVIRPAGERFGAVDQAITSTGWRRMTRTHRRTRALEAKFRGMILTVNWRAMIANSPNRTATAFESILRSPNAG